jgi:GT2 family glycosyltransferase
MSKDLDKPPKITIVILNWNGKKDTLECLHSVAKISYPRFTTLIVDNGSKDDSVSAIRKEFPGVEIIETGENLGFAEGNNVGIRHALLQGLLHAFTQSLEKHPQAGIFGGKLQLYSKRDLMDHWGGNWNPKKGSFDLVGLNQNADDPAWQKPLVLDYVCGAAFLVRKEVFEKIGLLEAKFFLVWEENDFCFRARKAGYLSMTCPEAKVWHKVSASFQGKPHTTYFWWRNRLLWIERNLSLSNTISIYLRKIIPEIFQTLKLIILKKAQLVILKIIRPKENQSQRIGKIIQYQAQFQGMRDYFFRRFGNAPPWIYFSCKKDYQFSFFKKKLSSKSAN